MSKARDISELSRQLYQRRKACGLSLETVAERLGIRGHSGISKAECGMAAPTLKRLGELADVYGCSVHDLIPADW